MRAIDADALIKELNGCHFSGAPYVDAGISIAVGKVCDALTIEPEREIGEWIKISPAGIYECSKCGQNVMTSDIDCYLFCHGCGANMRGDKKYDK